MKGQISKKTLSESKKELEFLIGDNKEYEIEVIIDSALYGK